ncbi:MAG: hypothetical protein M3Q54_03320 [Actinomycetota bacterium]|nr:hypothetical protein [Rubrobacter sp.]MDQ3236554.1 hypothetical protein [Actinomycetota bacterium]
MAREGTVGMFERAGWEVREEGDSAEVMGGAGRYEIRPDEKILGHETVFEIRDEELSVKAYARKVPTPERAAELLDRYGVPSGMSDATPGKVPLVPPGAEEDG